MVRVTKKRKGLSWVVFAFPKFSRELGHYHMKDHVEIGHLAKYGAFRVNRDQVMDLETWFKIHTGVSNFDTASPKTI